ncbi:hypothetical protein FISHEDRAFT_78898 [Fistulina hepatica ATCC 64428]|uniref:Uncharacterized protein n=1 Tax=Fistulina hepatica ATCC 64428 TaxID=1128425 RepID=A0A0D6ZZV3_9AGAR|nr:hypothetical protein FISHEDRAFT_78898 [Fistulina hepatica ATCC 64428]
MSSANLSQNRLPTEVWIEIFRSLYPSSDGLQQTLSQHREAFDHSASLTTSSLSKNDQRKYITALDPTRSIFTLSTVCSRWWRIITTYPVFWTFIVLDSPLRVPLVERCLARSGCLLLTVCIVCDSSEGIELLLSHSDRWKSAFVSPRLSDRINCSGRCFPNLEFFASSAWSRRGMMRFTIDVPRLSHYHALDDNAVPPTILDRLVHLTVSDWSLLHLLFVLEDAYCLQTLVILGGLSSDSTTVYNEKLEDQNVSRNSGLSVPGDIVVLDRCQFSMDGLRIKSRV